MAPVKVLLLGSLTVALLLATFASAQKRPIAVARTPGVVPRDVDFIETLKAASSSKKSLGPACPNSPCQVCNCGDEKKKVRCKVYYRGYYCQDYPSGTTTPDGGISLGCIVLSGFPWLTNPKNYLCFVTRWQYCEATVPEFCADLS